VLPSDLVDKYEGMEGWKRLEFDLAVLGEIHDQIKESTEDSKIWRPASVKESRELKMIIL
jgi:hypothetical protein